MAKGFTSLIGLAVVVALALAAVFGSMSLANPAMAQTADPRVSGVVVYVTDPDPALVDSRTITTAGTPDTGVAGVLTSGGAAAFEVAFAVEDDGADPASAVIFGEGDEITIDVGDFDLPSSFGSSSNVRMWIGDAIDAGDAAIEDSGDTTIVARIGDEVEIDNGTVTITVGDMSGSSATASRYIEEGDFVHVSFERSAGITAPEDLKTGIDGDNALRVNWEVDGVATATGVPVVATFEELPPEGAALTPDSYEPGENTRYRLVFESNTDITTGVHDITVELEDFDVPSSIGASAVSVSVTGCYTSGGIHDDTDPCPTTGDGARMITVTNTAADVAVDGEKITSTLKVASDDFVNFIPSGTEVTMIIRQSAGISNPTEGGVYGAEDGEKDEDIQITIDGASQDILIDGITVLRTLSLDPDDPGRGDIVEATGKGFKNGTTLLVFLDENMDNVLNGGEDVLCRAAIGGDDIGTCEFQATNPPLGAGPNRISAMDGRSWRPSPDEWDTLTLEPSIKVTPEGGTPGETMLIQLADFTERDVSRIRLSRQNICDDAGRPTPNLDADGDPIAASACNQVVTGTGDASFQIVIPDWAPDGKVDLRVDVGTGEDAQDASTVVTITGPVVSSTPSTVIANQRISLVGDGFNDGSEIASMTIGGETIIPARINGGEDVHVDNGGGWSASVNLPLSEATTSPGPRQLRVTDSEGRSGTVIVNIARREVSITPDVGRVGTLAVVRGSGFPSKNDDGSSFNVVVEYDAGDGESTVSTVPDASGRFEVQMRIPTTADIPSTNTVRVLFDTELPSGQRGDGPQVIMTATHSVPEGIVELSETSGSPGTAVGITGEGFKAYVPVQSVHVGSIEVTPSPAPSTDAQGMLDFAITIPGLDVGIQTIEVQVSGTTASKGFTVTESGVAAGDITPVAEAVEALSDNVVSVWHFNNDSKVWAFYDPTLMEGNTLTHMITGETYLIRVKSTTEVILNRETRSLTCVGDNCWNQIVW